MPEHTQAHGQISQAVASQRLASAGPDMQGKGLELQQGMIARALADPGGLPSNAVMYLQRAMGNRAVSQLLGRDRTGASVQSTSASGLRVGPVDDAYERAANQVAQEVVSHPSIQRSPQSLLQRLPAAPIGPDTASGSAGGRVSGDFEKRILANNHGGKRLPNHLRRTLEPKLGAELSSVRVHTDQQAVQLSRDLNAKAFTHKQHIFYGAGQSPNNLRLTAHETVHTVQQGAVRPFPHRPPIPVGFSPSAKSMTQRTPAEYLPSVKFHKNSAAPITTVQRVYVPPTGDVVTVGKTYQMKLIWYEAAIQVITAKIAVHGGGSGKIHVGLTLLLDDLQKQQNLALRRMNDDTPIIKEGGLEGHFPKELPGQLYREIAQVAGEDPKSVKEELRNAYIRALNNRQWDPIVKEMNFGAAGNPDHVTSTITPVNQNFHQTYGGGIGKGYGRTGLNSMSSAGRLTQNRDPKKENERTTNLAYSELRQGRANAQGKVLFAAFRSGALSGKDLKDPNNPTANWKATLANTKELLQAMTIKRLTQVDADDQREMLAGRKVLRIPVTSISLQSAWIGGEGRQIREQLAALESFDYAANNRKIHAMDVVWMMGNTQEKRYVMVRFDVIALNLGVNAQGFTDIGNSADVALVKLDAAIQDYRQMSGMAMRELKVTLNTTLDPNMHQQLQNRINDVMANNRKIAQLWSKIEGGKGTTGSYKMSSRIANLAFLLGHMVHYNCKSGKDRTGLQDAEAKYLALRMDQATRQDQDKLVPKVVPSYSLKNKGEKDTYQKMIFESGSLEMQQYNTGGQGYKVAPSGKLMPGDKELMDRVGGKAVLTQLQGLKRYTDIDKI